VQHPTVPSASVQLVGTPPPPDEEDEEEDELVVVLLLEALPVHDSPQIEVTSLTHMLSQRKSQQKGSVPQTSATQGSQLVVSELPVSQIGCEQVPPLEELELLDEVEVELDEDEAVSQSSGYVPLGSASDGGATQSYSILDALQPQTLPPVHVCSVTVVLVGVAQ
jgi:hypothetical protein